MGGFIYNYEFRFVVFFIFIGNILLCILYSKFMGIIMIKKTIGFKYEIIT